MPPIVEMMVGLRAQRISLKDTALENTDLEGLMKLLCRSVNLMAASLVELPGTYIMRHRKVTEDSPPLCKRLKPSDASR
jgi:hypothetical protein